MNDEILAVLKKNIDFLEGNNKVISLGYSVEDSHDTIPIIKLSVAFKVYPNIPKRWLKEHQSKTDALK